MAKTLGKGSPAHRVEPTHIKDLVADPSNRRSHNPRNLGMVVDALNQVGAARSIVIDEDNVVLAGNGVTEAAAEAGITRVRVVDADGLELIAVRRSGLTAEQKRALAIYDNRTAELAEWNFEQLAADKAAGLDLQPFWSEAEEAELLAGEVKPGKTDPDDVPAERSTGIVRGDLFELGSHRLLCGDCTVAGDVARLMGDVRAACVYTDPPYGVNYEGGTTKRRALAGDHGGTTIYAAAMPLILLASDERAPIYLWCADRAIGTVAAALDASRFDVRSLIIWNKNLAQFGALAAQYKAKHEPCFYAHRRGVSPYWFGPTNEVTVWDCSRATKNEFHPTQKPVELAIRAFGNSTQEGNAVVDLFLGSGATLVAAEQSDRCCFGVEIDPSYCQVIIDRWEAFTGLTATKVGEAVRA